MELSSLQRIPNWVCSSCEMAMIWSSLQLVLFRFIVLETEIIVKHTFNALFTNDTFNALFLNDTFNAVFTNDMI